MLELRPYQRASIDAIYQYFQSSTGNPLIVLPTGTGKSIVLAKFVQEVIAQYKDTRVLILTHVKELISQDFSELIRVWPDAPAGINSSGLGSRDTQSQILFCGIQSVHKHARLIQDVDLVIVDEAHLIPRKADTMYRRFLDDLRSMNPYLKVIGLTATPYRLDSGVLHEGDDAMFDAIAYEANVLDMIEQGYLAPVVPKHTAAQLNVEGVGTRGGDFIPGQLERAVDLDDINRSVVSEIVQAGRLRGSWLVFCTGVSHARHMAALLSTHTSVSTVFGDTPTQERDQAIARFKRGEIRCLVNVDVLTTGFNAPGVDLIALVRPTKSVGFYVQMVGRGTRTANGKDDCLVLDFAGNTARHGPIDKIKVGPKGKGEGEAPVKVCPACDTICYAGVRNCPTCGHAFPPPEPEIASRASTSALLSTQIQAEWIEVTGVRYDRHLKEGKPDSLRVTYECGLNRHREWVCVQHTGYPRQKAVAWWSRRAPGRSVPATVDEALVQTETLAVPTRIAIKPDGKYVAIVAVDLSPRDPPPRAIG